MADAQVNNQYNFKESEEKLKKFWNNNQTYKFKSNKAKKKIYSIDTPPPYISGKMHIGHAFSYSQQDFIARYRRMKEGQVFYPFGTDDNGLPTERFIEKLKGVKSKEMGRAEFIKLCIKTLEEVTPDCVQDFKDLGISADYDLKYSTIDEHSQKVSQKSFLELLKKGEAYHKEFPTIWCCECQTAVAQAELEDKELPSKFSTLKFKVKETGKDLLIATTRPELLGACVAVFINPKDERVSELKDKTAIVPLFKNEVPILEDESAQLDKGTGLLMICSYGDKFDVEAIARHNLSPRVIFDKTGKLTNERYNGLSIKAARKETLKDLAEEELIVEQKEIKHSVNVHDKCGSEIEFIPTKQWFIKVLDKKEELIKRGKKIVWRPEYMYKRYENWVLGLDWDWNISRNRHFGVPIPVWECEECGEIITPEEKELPVDPIEIKKNCPKCKKEAKAETMVLDTWATSSLTPQITESLENADGKIKIPFSLRPQGHDIIRTWAFYTIVKALLHENNIPWSDIMISGNVSMNGEKMSKSKGNVVDPRLIMENHGADALRFWAAGSKLGEDLDYQEKDLLNGKKFITKLWNATKFVFMGLQDFDGKKPEKFERIDELFLDKLNSLVKSCTESFENYEYSRVKMDVEKFFWQSFCDNYLEIVKNRIYNAEGDKKKSAQYALYTSLLTILKLIAPIMPFITEEIYQAYFKKTEKDESIHISEWPKFDKEVVSVHASVSPDGQNELDIFYEILTAIRQEKSKAQKSMKAEIILTIEKEKMKKIEDILEDLKAVACAKEIKEGTLNVEFI
jgi:valyl-tRNA synthetase